MEIQELLEHLTLFDGKYNRSEIDEALLRRDEIIPYLIEILENVLASPEKYAEDRNYFGHIYAVMLLGHFNEDRAHNIIADIFSLPDDLPYKLFGDITTEDLPVILLRTCGGSFDNIKKLILNREADEYCRGSALKAMTYGIVDGVVTRDEVLSFFKNIFEDRKSEPPSHFFDALASCICDLYPEELIDIIKQCYEDNYIDPIFIGFNSFELALEKGRENCLNELQESLASRSLDDIHQRMSWWACFKNDRKESIINMKSSQKAATNSKKKKKNRKKMIKATKKKTRRKRKHK
jgi:hypothetical protein